MLTCVKRVEAQKAQRAVIDTIIQKDIKHSDKRPTTNILSTRRRCKYCRQEQKPRQCPTYGKRSDKCRKLNHFKEKCRGARGSAVNTIEKETVHKQEHCIKMVNINSVSFNSNHSTIIANLKISSYKSKIAVP